MLVVCLFLFGFLILKGPGNIWVCKNGEWIKIGNLNKEMPEKSCGVIDTIKGNILVFTENYRTNSKLLNTKNYSNQSLDKVPPELLFMRDAVVIKLDHNNLSFLPEDFSKLTKVKELYLDYNNFAGISAGLGNLSELETLDLSNNILKEIPKEIGKLKKLRRLDLSRNDLKDLPEEFYDLKDNLKNLDIFENNFDVDFIIDLQDKLPNTGINF